MSGGCVIRYDGKRGTVWRLKYVDGSGKQVMETVGAERDGWTERRAREALADRLSDVRRRGHRKPAPLTFASYVDRWLNEAERRRDWRPRTRMAVVGSVERLRPYFGPLRLAAIRPPDVSAFVREALDGYAPATVNLDVNVLVDVFNCAMREELVDRNPAKLAERPKLPRRNWRILEPAEVGRVAAAFTDQQARVAFLVLVLTGLRRHELQALRWRDVDMLTGVLRVRDSKTEEGIRSIALSSRLTEALSEHWQRTAFRGDDELVFCHPQKGTLYDAKAFADALRATMWAAGVDGADVIRAFHDLRHTAITNDAASGSSAIAVMSKAGHADMKTTKRYLHLAGVVFRNEADALEARMLGATDKSRQSAVESSTDLGEPQRISAD